MSNKCFCHLNGLAVKDATARRMIEELLIINTINGKKLKFFVGTQEEYDALTEDEKTGVFGVISDDKTKEEIEKAIKKCISNEGGTIYGNLNINGFLSVGGKLVVRSDTLLAGDQNEGGKAKNGIMWNVDGDETKYSEFCLIYNPENYTRGLYDSITKSMVIEVTDEGNKFNGTISSKVFNKYADITKKGVYGVIYKNQSEDYFNTIIIVDDLEGTITDTSGIVQFYNGSISSIHIDYEVEKIFLITTID